MDAPVGVFPLLSPTTQIPPIAQSLSVPLDLAGGWPGSMTASLSYTHSPANCWSRSCSFLRPGRLGRVQRLEHGRSAQQRHHDPAITIFFMMLSFGEDDERPG